MKIGYWAMLALVITGNAAQRVHAQESLSESATPIHWAFASLVGTGWYEVDDGRSAFVVGATPRQIIRKTPGYRPGENAFGIFARYDAAAGVFGIPQFPDIADKENFSTISFTPGVELEIPLREHWRLRPFANFGWGTALGDGASAWIYYAGIKSEYLFDFDSRTVAVLNGLYYAGYNPDQGPSGALASLFSGLELRHGSTRLRWRREPVDLLWHIGYSVMSDQASFGLRDGGLTSIGNTAEFGLAIALRERPFRLWSFEFDRLGLTYSTSGDGEFGALVLNLSSWFTK
ncbi:MAG: hypothetical protein ACSLE2_08855 [Lysobacterales bacterium]